MEVFNRIVRVFAPKVDFTSRDWYAFAGWTNEVAASLSRMAIKDMPPLIELDRMHRAGLSADYVAEQYRQAWMQKGADAWK